MKKLVLLATFLQITVAFSSPDRMKIVNPSPGGDYTDCSEFFNNMNDNRYGTGVNLDKDGNLLVPKTAQHHHRPIRKNTISSTNNHPEGQSRQYLILRGPAAMPDSNILNIITLDRSGDGKLKRVIHSYLSVKDKDVDDRRYMRRQIDLNRGSDVGRFDIAYDLTMTPGGKCIVDQTFDRRTFFLDGREFRMGKEASEYKIAAKTQLCKKLDDFFKAHPGVRGCANLNNMNSLLGVLEDHVADQNWDGFLKSRIRGARRGIDADTKDLAKHRDSIAINNPHAIASELANECERHGLRIFYDDISDSSSTTTESSQEGGKVIGK